MLKHLSILDQSAVAVGVSHQQVMQETVDLAIAGEQMGYRRFWVSEHHSHPTIVGTAPEILMAAISQKTQTIRLGSAGVMLPHYSALKVAEQFRVLEALAPGRIDLGVGRAPGSDMRTAQLLNPNARAESYFPMQVQELDLWLRDAPFPEGHPGRGVFAYPQTSGFPELWILGSSQYGAQLAAHLGLPYVFAHFITDGVGAKEAIDLYYQQFRPSARLSKPQVIVCLWALAAGTAKEAYEAFRSRARFKIDRSRGRIGPLLAPQNALDGLSESDIEWYEALCQDGFVGDAAHVVKKMVQLAAELDIEEIAVITWAHDAQVRKKSYQLIAQQHRQLLLETTLTTA
jgi:luciferase family oxidoreductase group 1